MVLVDGYQQLRIGRASAVAVTAYTLPGDAPVSAPPPDADDFVCVEFMLAAADGRRDAFVWLCDVTYERYPDTAYLLAGRLDHVVAQRMRSVDLLLVLDVPTSSEWTIDNVRLIVPNDKGLCSPAPRVG